MIYGTVDNSNDDECQCTEKSWIDNRVNKDNKSKERMGEANQLLWLFPTLNGEGCL